MLQRVLEEGEDGIFFEVSDDTQKIPIPEVFGDLMLLARHQNLSGGICHAFDFDCEERAGIGGLETKIEATAETSDVGEYVACEIGEFWEG